MVREVGTTWTRRSVALETFPMESQMLHQLWGNTTRQFDRLRQLRRRSIIRFILHHLKRSFWLQPGRALRRPTWRRRRHTTIRSFPLWLCFLRRRLRWRRPSLLCEVNVVEDLSLILELLAVWLVRKLFGISSRAVLLLREKPMSWSIGLRKLHLFRASLARRTTRWEKSRFPWWLVDKPSNSKAKWSAVLDPYVQPLSVILHFGSCEAEFSPSSSTMEMAYLSQDQLVKKIPTTWSTSGYFWLTAVTTSCPRMTRPTTTRSRRRARSRWPFSVIKLKDELLNFGQMWEESLLRVPKDSKRKVTGVKCLRVKLQRLSMTSRRRWSFVKPLRRRTMRLRRTKWSTMRLTRMRWRIPRRLRWSTPFWLRRLQWWKSRHTTHWTTIATCYVQMLKANLRWTRPTMTTSSTSTSTPRMTSRRTWTTPMCRSSRSVTRRFRKSSTPRAVWDLSDLRTSIDGSHGWKEEDFDGISGNGSLDPVVCLSSWWPLVWSLVFQWIFAMVGTSTTRSTSLCYVELNENFFLEFCTWPQTAVPGRFQVIFDLLNLRLKTEDEIATLWWRFRKRPKINHVEDAAIMWNSPMEALCGRKTNNALYVFLRFLIIEVVNAVINVWWVQKTKVEFRFRKLPVLVQTFGGDEHLSDAVVTKDNLIHTFKEQRQMDWHVLPRLPYTLVKCARGWSKTWWSFYINEVCWRQLLGPGATTSSSTFTSVHVVSLVDPALLMLSTPSFLDNADMDVGHQVQVPELKLQMPLLILSSNGKFAPTRRTWLRWRFPMTLPIDLVKNMITTSRSCSWRWFRLLWRLTAGKRSGPESLERECLSHVSRQGDL